LIVGTIKLCGFVASESDTVASGATSCAVPPAVGGVSSESSPTAFVSVRGIGGWHR
jgi:hypothetical protein